MAFQWFTIAFSWAAGVLFIALVVYKIHLFVAMPINLRWEVYPVPHEAGDKRRYGGSYMEETGWAKRPRLTFPFAGLVEMGSEVFLLKRVREHNPYHLWPLSLALHWGLYLLIFWLGLLAVAVILPPLAFLIPTVGIAAFVLGGCGAVGLIVKRATHRGLALYTAPIDYFNLSFLAAIFFLGFASWLGDPHFSQHRSYLASLLSFRPTLISPAVVFLFFLIQSFAVYMPCSKLIHYVMKHFAFHEVLWDDAFKIKGSPTDRQLERQLSYPLSWAGSHITQGKTWREDAQESSEGKSNVK